MTRPSSGPSRTTNVLIELSKFGLATLILATVAAAAQAESLPRRVRSAGLFASALLILSALPPLLFDSGILQFGGGVEVLAAVPAALWLVWLSVRCARITIPSACRGSPS